MNQDDTNLNFGAQKAAVYLNVAAQTLANWRHLQKGPPYIKLSGRIIYRRADLDSYLQRNRIDPEQAGGAK